ncbi:DUF6355 family natural product biosynthesis protein [Streptomyces sp. CB03238]|uniref:DUF6355 family natural product biosynthesis protein n=1 Tax=Streptomyces sp. CB03238 TaxID=1907777 RepID=UPI000A111B36|nr:DUF6355 family natural product biosynthesis protein [Streptomyces sp. CB03238]ORT58541.1 hypothetical protein BKD26_18255 [Streptomyces sp. CB03238]
MRRTSRTLRALATAGLMTVAGVTGGLATAGTATAAESGTLACGWDPDAAAGIAYYNHCANNRVVIRVERHNASGYDQCVGPGRTYLGSTSVIKYAWYAGRLC